MRRRRVRRRVVTEMKVREINSCERRCKEKNKKNIIFHHFMISVCKNAIVLVVTTTSVPVCDFFFEEREEGKNQGKF